MIRLWRLARLLQEGSLYVLLFLLPFAKASVAIGFGLILIGWLFDRLNPATRAQTFWATPRARTLLILLSAYFGVCALSITVSDAPRLSLVGAIGKWLKYLLFFVMLTDLGSRVNVVKRSLVVMALSSLCVAVQGLFQELSLQKMFWWQPVFQYRRMVGSYENPIDFGTYLIVLIPIMLTFAVSEQKWRRWLLGGLVLLLSWCLIRTRALGAWLALFMGLFVLMNRLPRVRRALVMLCTVLVVGGGLYLQHVGRLHRLMSLQDIGVGDRWMMWQAATGMIKDRPLLGHGVNTFMFNYLRYWVGGERSPRYAHNCYLQVAAETGLVGLVVFLSLLGVFFSKLIRVVYRVQSKESLLLAGLLAGLLAFVLQSAVDTNFYSLRQAALFWVLAGLALGLSE